MKEVKQGLPVCFSGHQTVTELTHRGRTEGVDGLLLSKTSTNLKCNFPWRLTSPGVFYRKDGLKDFRSSVRPPLEFTLACDGNVVQSLPAPLNLRKLLKSPPLRLLEATWTACSLWAGETTCLVRTKGIRDRRSDILQLTTRDVLMHLDLASCSWEHYLHGSTRFSP